MPYIKQEHREPFYSDAFNLGQEVQNAGDINYTVSVILHSYIKKVGLKYANINEVIGALECCKLELYRAVAGPYETEKVNENGPVGIIKEFGVNPTKDIPGQQTIF